MDEKMAGLINIEEIREMVKKELLPSIEAKLKDDLRDLITKDHVKQRIRDDVPSIKFVPNMQDAKIVDNYKEQPKIGTVGLTACAGALIHMFGRKGAESIVNDYYKRAWIDYELRQSLLELMDTIHSRDIPDEKDIGVNEHAIAAYLFDKLKKNGSDLDFVVILVSLTLPSKFFITK
jgi:hypothetical protein